MNEAARRWNGGFRLCRRIQRCEGDDEDVGHGEGVGIVWTSVLSTVGGTHSNLWQWQRDEGGGGIRFDHSFG